MSFDGTLFVGKRKKSDDMEIVINKCYGGFGLSALAVKMYLKLKGKNAFFYVQTKYSFRNGKDEYKKVSIENASSAYMSHTMTKDLGNTTSKLLDKHYFSDYSINRSDKDLIRVVSELGKKANGRHAELKIVEIPDGTAFEIEEYDGMERVAETHETWG